MSAQSAVAALFFGVGIIALLFVFRRSILLKRLEPSDAGGERLRLRSLQAHAEIDQIDARAWLARYRRAAKFVRGHALSKEQRRLLAGLARRQAPPEVR